MTEHARVAALGKVVRPKEKKMRKSYEFGQNAAS